MDRDDVDWRGYWPACPPRSPRTAASRSTAARRCSSCYVGEGLHGVLVNGTTGRVVLADRRRAPARRGDGDRRRRRTRCRSWSAAPTTPRAGRRARAATRSPRAPPGSLHAAAVHQAVRPTRSSRTTRTSRARSTRPLDDLQLAARHERRDRDRARRPARRHRHRRRRSRTRRRTRSSSTRPRAPSSTACASSARTCRARASSTCSPHGGDGTIGGGSLFGRADAEFWEALLARRPRRAALAHAQRTERLFPKLWLPGGWARQARPLREPAQGADGDARPAGRHRPASAAADHRPGRAGTRCARSWPRRGSSRTGHGAESVRGRLPLGTGLARGAAVTIAVDGRQVTALRRRDRRRRAAGRGRSTDRASDARRVARAASSAVWVCASTASPSSTACPTRAPAWPGCATAWTFASRTDGPRRHRANRRARSSSVRTGGRLLSAWSRSREIAAGATSIRGPSRGSKLRATQRNWTAPMWL